MFVVFDPALPRSVLCLPGIAGSRISRIPKDIQDWTSSNGHRSEANIPKHSADIYAPACPLPPAELLHQAADLINKGKKITILAGRGCLNARNELIQLAERVGGVIIKPLLGKAVVPDDNAFTTGGIGLLGTAPSQEAMANSLPYSLGAVIAYPNRQIICIVGDGGFTMLMGEVATLVKYKLPVKVVIFKNNLLGMIKWEQIVFEGNPQFGVELQPIDFAAYARACGAGGFTIEDPATAPAILSEALAYDGPAVVEAIIDPYEPPLPGNVTMKQAVKFGEALLRGQKDRWDIIKTVAEDKIREVI